MPKKESEERKPIQVKGSLSAIRIGTPVEIIKTSNPQYRHSRVKLKPLIIASEPKFAKPETPSSSFRGRKYYKPESEYNTYPIKPTTPLSPSSIRSLSSVEISPRTSPKTPYKQFKASERLAEALAEVNTPAVEISLKNEKLEIAREKMRRVVTVACIKDTFTKAGEKKAEEFKDAREAANEYVENIIDKIDSGMLMLDYLIDKYPFNSDIMLAEAQDKLDSSEKIIEIEEKEQERAAEIEDSLIRLSKIPIPADKDSVSIISKNGTKYTKDRLDEKIVANKISKLFFYKKVKVETSKGKVKKTIEDLYSNYVLRDEKLKDINTKLKEKGYKATTVQSNVKYIQEYVSLAKRFMGYDALQKELLKRAKTNPETGKTEKSDLFKAEDGEINLINLADRIYHQEIISLSDGLEDTMYEQLNELVEIEKEGMNTYKNTTDSYIKALLDITNNYVGKSSKKERDFQVIKDIGEKYQASNDTKYKATK